MDFIERIKKRSSDKSGWYTDIAKIGQGSFGEVYYGRNARRRRERVAIKQLLHLNNEYQCTCAVREIQILTVLHHKNVIELSDVCLWGKPGETPKLSLVFEFCPHDLEDLIFYYKGGKEDCFTLAEKKTIMREILCGLEYIHSKNIMHRDLKPANILITESGRVKVADLGLARHIYKPKPNEPQNYLTPGLFTICFRPPEVLLGCQNYGTSADMWCLGFIFVELLFRAPFGGDTNINQLQKIVDVCGTIGTDIWPGVDRLPHYEDAMAIVEHCDNPFMLNPGFVERFADMYAHKFFQDLLILNPKERMTATEALHHKFFHHDPQPQELNVSKLSTPQLRLLK